VFGATWFDVLVIQELHTRGVI